MVRHLAEGERAGFRVLMAGQDAPRLYSSGGDVNSAVAGRHMGHVDLLRERIDGRIGQ